MEQFSFVFVATDDMRIRGVSGWVCYSVCNYCLSSQYDVSGTSMTLDTDSSFYNQQVTSDVYQLSWQEGLNYITAVTNNSVSIYIRPVPYLFMYVFPIHCM